MDAKKLGKRIKIARIEMDISQGELAATMGILQKSLSTYETGRTMPPLEILIKIAKALKKPYEYFLDD